MLLKNKTKKKNISVALKVLSLLPDRISAQALLLLFIFLCSLRRRKNPPRLTDYSGWDITTWIWTDATILLACPFASSPGTLPPLITLSKQMSQRLALAWVIYGDMDAWQWPRSRTPEVDVNVVHAIYILCLTVQLWRNLGCLLFYTLAMSGWGLTCEMGTFIVTL